MLIAITLLLSASAAISDDGLPMWKGNLKNVVGVWSSEGNSNSLIVVDKNEMLFRCRLSENRNFQDVFQLEDCRPILDKERLDLQHSENTKRLAAFLRKEIPDELCGAEVSELYDAFYDKYDDIAFSDEFGRWKQRPQNSLVRKVIEDMDEVIIIEAKFSPEIRVILEKYLPDLDQISTSFNDVRVLKEEACN